MNFYWLLTDYQKKIHYKYLFHIDAWTECTNFTALGLKPLYYWRFTNLQPILVPLTQGP